VRKLETLYDEIVAAGNPQPTILPLDLATASADDFGQVAGAIRAQLGRLDGLVHTAAFLGSLSPVEHQSFDTWQKVLCVNLAAAMALTRSLLPIFVRSDASVAFTLDGRERSASLLGCIRRGQGRTFGSGVDSGGRVGKPAQPAHRRCGSRTDAHAASRAYTSG
jgi:NAD(P)-dependent dehydrogenase (short-subunit alcohol dehydrogenase family)